MENNIPEQNKDAIDETVSAEEITAEEEEVQAEETDAAEETASEEETVPAEKKALPDKKTEKAPESRPKKSKKPINSYKRSTIRQFSSTLSLYIMVPVIAAILVFVWCFPRSEKSEIENRNLTEFPEFSFDSYFSGGFTSGINKWFTDTTPYRDDIKNMSNSFKNTFGITTDDTVHVVGEIKKAPKTPVRRS